MTFSNDELKRLKDLIEAHLVSDEWMVKRLIARLEAAERPLIYADGDSRFSDIQGMIDAWRKAAGK